MWVRRWESKFLMRQLDFYYISPGWILDAPAGDWSNFSKTLIVIYSVKEIITLQVALLSIVICPPVQYWELITFLFLLHTDNSPRKLSIMPLLFYFQVFFPLKIVFHLCGWIWFFPNNQFWILNVCQNNTDKYLPPQTQSCSLIFTRLS